MILAQKKSLMQSIKINFPRKLVFGDHSLEDFKQSFLQMPYRNVFIIADPNVGAPVDNMIRDFQNADIECIVNRDVSGEPTVSHFSEINQMAGRNNIDAVIGIGGGSVLDVAKLTAVLSDKEIPVADMFGTDKVPGRKIFLCCLPTTAGTGSEVSPNAILLDENENLKKGIISPYLVPDVTYVDPQLTHTVPQGVTASTGIDALTHCIEAYANRFAHPMVDLYALEGIRLIVGNLETAFHKSSDAEARTATALGSLYGGLCLGPVNTAAVHALSYPLGSEYHIPHGISNAILLPHILEFNLSDGINRYAAIAKTIGVEDCSSEEERARKGIEKIAQLCKNVGIPEKLSEFNVPQEDVPKLADSAYSVQRLLKNNLHEMTKKDIVGIYMKLF